MPRLRITESHLGRLRASAGLSQAALAELIGVGPTQMSDMERGETLPNDEQAERLAEVLKQSLEKVQHAARKDGLRYARRLAEHRRATLDPDADRLPDSA